MVSSISLRRSLHDQRGVRALQISEDLVSESMLRNAIIVSGRYALL